MEDIVVRALDIDRDLPRWLEIHSDPLIARDVLQIPYATLDDWRTRLQGGSVRQRTLVAEIDGEVVGGLGLTVFEGRRSHAGAFGMAVARDSQGHGVGSALVKAALDLADNWYKLHRLELEVYTENERAIALYKKFGFEIEGTMKAYAIRDGKFADAYRMARIHPASASNQ